MSLDLSVFSFNPYSSSSARLIPIFQMRKTDTKEGHTARKCQSQALNHSGSLDSSGYTLFFLIFGGDIGQPYTLKPPLFAWLLTSLRWGIRLVGNFPKTSLPGDTRNLGTVTRLVLHLELWKLDPCSQ